ncbi:hypothetical protein ACQP1G_20790 [Nocardia sp. CA-107356]|uniref:hypothetical protein n=1 Tax=Nocardia sp. CA-107356 TaxID=3239972 RepID=UPI003D915DCC
MSDNGQRAASAIDTADSEYTLDIHLLATVKVRAKDLNAARRKLRTELGAIDLPDYAGRVTDHIDVSSIEFRGAVRAFAPRSSPEEQSAEAFYDGGGFELMERLMVHGHDLPLLFRPVQLSPSGEDMRPMTPHKLDAFMGVDHVIRVGLASEVCVEPEIDAPEVFIEDDVLRIASRGDEAWEPVTGFGDSDKPIMPSPVPISDKLAELILRRPGLYVQVHSGCPDHSRLVLHCDDSEQVWAAKG